MKWPEAASRYLNEYSAIHHSKSSRAKCRAVFDGFEGIAKDLDLEAIGRSHLATYQRRAIQRRLSPSTVNMLVRTLKAAFFWFEGMGWISRNPAKGLRMLKVIRRSANDKVLTDEEIGRILAHLQLQKLGVFADLVNLVLNTGLRLGEALWLQVGDVDFQKRLLHIRNTPEHLLKDRQDRIVPMNGVAVAVLEPRADSARTQNGLRGFLFPSRKGRPYDISNMSGDFKRHVREAGVGKANWYALRHTFGTRMAEFATPYQLAAIMGHSDISTTNRFYVHREAMNLPTPPPVGSAPPAAPQTTPAPVRTLSPKQVAEVLAHLDRSRSLLYPDLARLALHAGLLPLEALRLTAKDVNLETRQVRVSDETGERSGVRLKSRTIPLDEVLMGVFERRVREVVSSGNPSGPLFNTKAPKNYLRQISLRFKSKLLRAGVPGATLQALRELYAEKLAGHLKPDKLAELLGFPDVACVERYYAHRNARSIKAPPALA